MSTGEVIVLHARQPMGAGTCRIAERFGEGGATVLTEGEGPLFRNPDDASRVAIERKPVAQWWQRVAERTGGVRVITNDEFCLERARELRGHRTDSDAFPADLSLYRNKTRMRERLRSAGLSVPETVTFPPGTASARELSRAVTRFGGRAVLKPDNEANLQGVEIVNSETALEERAANTDQGRTWLLEHYYDGPQFHVNCVVEHGRITPLLAGEYVAPLLELRCGRPSGSITLDSADPRRTQLMDQAVQALHALGTDGRFVAHVEFLSSGDEVCISELTCRAPGGEIPFQSRWHCGTDIEELNLGLQLGDPVPTPESGEAAAWLWFPGQSLPDHLPDACGEWRSGFAGVAWFGHAPETQAVQQQLTEALARFGFYADSA